MLRGPELQEEKRVSIFHEKTYLLNLCVAFYEGGIQNHTLTILTHISCAHIRRKTDLERYSSGLRK